MARWGDEKTLRFVRLYRLHDTLWNPRSPLYSKAKDRVCAYYSMLEQFNDDSLDVKSIKSKIKNLRSIYHTELRKIRESRSSKSVYRPTLSWFDEMHAFMEDTLLDRQEIRESTVNSQSNAHSIPDIIVPELKDKEVVHIKLEPPSNPNVNPLEITAEPAEEVKLNTNIQESTAKPCVISASYSLKKDDTRPMKRKTIRRNKPYTENKVLNAVVSLENKVSSVIQETKQDSRQTGDEFHMFALSVAAQMRQLPLHVAIATQSRIQNILSEARISSLYSGATTLAAISIIKAQEMPTD